MTTVDDAIPPFKPTPDGVLDDMERETRLRSARIAAELTVEMDWPHCPLHIVPLHDDATCGWCSPEEEA